MGTSTSPQRPPPGQPTVATYWRRRFVALVGCLSVLAFITWAVSGMLGGSTPAAGSTAAGSRHGEHTSSAPPQSTPSVTPSLSPTASGSATATPDQASGTPTPQVTAGTATPATSGLRACAANAVVLSLFSGQPSNSAPQTPVFDIDVVSTASQPCAFDIGSKHVLLEVSSGGKQIWSSGECAEGQASLVTTLRRGVPTMVVMTWNGERSASNCPAPGNAVGRGSYTAMASAGSLHSNSLTFQFG